MRINATELYILMLVLVTLTLLQGQRGCNKAKVFASLISYSSQSIWMDFGMLLILAGVIHLILNLYCPIDIQRREP